MLQLQVGSWDELRDAARAVREAVFIREQGIPEHLEWDDDDARSLHAVAFDPAGRAVGCARLLPDGHIGRVAVLRDQRGEGAGSALMRELMRQARAAGHAAVELSAQQSACGFYQRLGFVASGPPHVEVGIAHQRMRAALEAND